MRKKLIKLMEVCYKIAVDNCLPTDVQNRLAVILFEKCIEKSDVIASLGGRLDIDTLIAHLELKK
jgi:hypothetical protein